MDKIRINSRIECNVNLTWKVIYKINNNKELNREINKELEILIFNKIILLTRKIIIYWIFSAEIIKFDYNDLYFYNVFLYKISINFFILFFDNKIII